MTDPNLPDEPGTPVPPPSEPGAAPSPPSQPGPLHRLRRSQGRLPPPSQPAPGYGAPQAAPAYGQPAPAYGQPGLWPSRTGPKTNTLAIISLIASIAGIVILWGIGSIAGMICGHISISQIKKTGEQGRGMALAGLIIGYVGIALAIIGVIIVVALSAWLVSSTVRSTTSDTERCVIRDVQKGVNP